MKPGLRITGHGAALTMTLKGLTPGQTVALRDVLKTASGSEHASVPLSFSPAGRTDPSLVLTGTGEGFGSAVRILSNDKNLFPPLLLKKIKTSLDNYLRSDYKIKCRGKILDLGSRTAIMGILNVTPDSFSDGGRFAEFGPALAHAREMAAGGADIIDLGGESTRPGAEPLSEQAELDRIIPLTERLASELDIPLSVDTYKASVAAKALRAGASIVNDISGLRFSPDMAKVVADSGAAVVIMHIQGTPRNMQQNPVYKDVVGEILSYLEEGIGIALNAGVERDQILVDPGIGFGKTLEHNLEILNRLDEFRVLGRPVLVGTSRKKFIGTVLDVPVPEQRREGTAATVALAIERGASVVRVHDVAPMAQVARMSDAIVRAKRQL
jgi:dihydropteroate synthase